MMRGLLRPSVLLSAALVAVAALLAAWVSGGLFGPRGKPPPQPLPVGAADREIVWLDPATNSAAWDRFVTGIKHSAKRLAADFPGITADSEDAYPRHAFITPQVALALPDGRRLVFRWYKLTSDWKTADWITALLRRDPPPLAIMGGSSSDAARELALELARLSAELPAPRRPLLLLTQATANRVPADPADSAHRPQAEGDAGQLPGVGLCELYPGRTFRFCFSNRQMAATVTRFVWSREELRPDADPVYMVQWVDDSYSTDLLNSFLPALAAQLTESAVRQWGWVTGAALGGQPPGFSGGPFPVDRAGYRASAFSLSSTVPSQRVDSSVGLFATPNRFESEQAAQLLDQVVRREGPVQEHPLLILTGQSGPARRFLRAVERYSPQPARRIVVATGDGLSFNTVYRDRQIAWPIQDLPYDLVFFCHRNPVDREAGFRPVGEAAPDAEATAAATTGTEDVLLYQDVIEALAYAQAAADADADVLRPRLSAIRIGTDGRITGSAGGTPFFDAAGERRSGTGEHVVWLHPQIELQAQKEPFGNDREPVMRVQPAATLEVWAWQPAGSGGVWWQQAGETLSVSYVNSPQNEGGAP
jgi:hypothetical protein